MVSRKPALIAVAAALVLAAVACAQIPPSGPGTPDDPARGRPTAGHPPAGQSPADAAARVEEVGSRHPRQYAGIAVSGVTLVVYRRPGGDLDDAVRAVAGNVSVVFRDAPHTRQELIALAARIQADLAYWRNRGVPIWSVLPRHDGSGVEVGTPAGDRLAAAARDRYGDAPIIVLRMTEPPVTAPATTS
ncbi:hypothetical protein I6A84_28525 [Frankia sp. CNm7]|uniref:Lipoprotein n=1 Tax=Frankia nepalensis TaxID=1836974 RepID=A0A937URS8_9ACTN|nr:hypothetical protein [Frankia nepalensis]MBL7498917.1 hypothetical protein [Frankia nepalensis]MBL7513087.1 hypothetical protein [Frankia nepalensis]MBL7521919.1 hypothetical protein [Frankia nepalensis]MBL7628111.1 hypothetical protein [Frankia nepalensis]